MADLSLPSQELLLQLLRYEAETGKLFWLERPLESFARASRNDRDNRWQAYGRFARKMEYIGQFTIFEDAKEARRKWELAKGFHPNHGQR